MAQTTLTLGARHRPSRFLIALVMSDDCAKFQEDWLKGFREKVHVIVFSRPHGRTDARPQGRTAARSDHYIDSYDFSYESKMTILHRD